jgi:hypothetical protein
MPSGYDPMDGYRFSLATNAERVCAEIISNKEMERDDDSKKSHLALVFHFGRRWNPDQISASFEPVGHRPRQIPKANTYLYRRNGLAADQKPLWFHRRSC